MKTIEWIKILYSSLAHFSLSILTIKSWLIFMQSTGGYKTGIKYLENTDIICHLAYFSHIIICQSHAKLYLGNLT